MKHHDRIIALGLTLLLLAGCSFSGESPLVSPPPVELSLTREELPRLDGSTSTVPLAQAVCAVLLGEEPEAVEELTKFSRTTQAYRNLIGGKADLLLAAEPAETVVKEKRKADFAWELAPIATDALVFLVNEDNPVDSLTHQQVVDIYAGKITNWKEVGGEDRPILPFQRNEEAGSQTLMKKLVMGDTPLMEPEKDYRVESMFGLIEAVRSFDGSPGAIGYTVYYYANDMNMAEGLKTLKIDGAAPQVSTIRSGTYPYTNPYYAVISADAPRGGSARKVFDWLQSEAGQSLIQSQGYVSIRSDLPKVDWGLEKEPVKEVYTRLTADTISTLKPSSRYGPLLPFVGQVLPTDDWFKLERYGLVTKKGKIVLDAVCDSIFKLTDGTGEATGVYGMSRTVPGEPKVRYAMAATDGSRVTEFVYRYVEAVSPDRFWVVEEDGTGVMLDSAWNEVFRIPLPTGETPDLFVGGMNGSTWWMEGYGFVHMWGDDFRQAILRPDGVLLEGGELGWSSPAGFYDGLCAAREDASRMWGYLDENGRWAIAPQYVSAGNFEAGRAIVTTLEGTTRVIEKSGAVRLETRAQVMRAKDGDRSCYLSYDDSAAAQWSFDIYNAYDGETLQPVDCLLTGETVRILGEHFWRDGPEGVELLTPWEKMLLPVHGNLHWVEEDCYIVSSEDGTAWTAVREDGTIILEKEACLSMGFLRDGGEDTLYLYTEKENGYTLFTHTGKRLMESRNDMSVDQGMIRIQEADHFGYRTRKGDWKFCVSLLKGGED